jgi:hypothetical protein
VLFANLADPNIHEGFDKKEKKNNVQWALKVCAKQWRALALELTQLRDSGVPKRVETRLVAHVKIF